MKNLSLGPLMGRHFRPRFLPGRPGVEKAGLPTQNRSLHGGGKGARAPGVHKPKLLDQVREAIRMRHYSVRTEEAYVSWIKRFIFFHGKRHPLEMGQQEITQFLSALAVKAHVSASTQNQALCALLFLYREVLARDIGCLDDVVRAKRPRRLPVVLTRQEVKMLLGALQDSQLDHGHLALWCRPSSPGVSSAPSEGYRLRHQSDRGAGREGQ